MKLSTTILMACLLGAGFVHADPVVRARSAGAFNGAHVDAAGQRRVLGDGQGNVNASGSAAFRTANGSTGSRSASFTRNADGTASGERSSSVTNANTGVSYNGSTSYTRGSGISRSGSCTDASGNTVTCGAAR